MKRNAEASQSWGAADDMLEITLDLTLLTRELAVVRVLFNPIVENPK